MMSDTMGLTECVVVMTPPPIEPTRPVVCGFACALKRKNCTGKQCGDWLNRNEIVEQANHVIAAKNQEY
jgi:hypothetical protein